MSHDTDTPIWSFDIGIQGPFSIKNRWGFDEVDAFFPPFFHSIEAKSTPFGAQLACQVNAETCLIAQQGALHCVNALLDVLGTQTNIPITATLLEDRPFARERFSAKRSMSKGEWQQAFYQAHHFSLHEPIFMGALGWYRRALIQESIPQRYTSLCRAVECITTDDAPSAFTEEHLAQAHHHSARLWGERTNWPSLSHTNDGLAPFFTTARSLQEASPSRFLDTLRDVFDTYEQLHKFTHAFLTEWRNQTIELPGEFFHTTLHTQTTWGHILQ